MRLKPIAMVPRSPLSVADTRPLQPILYAETNGLMTQREN